MDQLSVEEREFGIDLEAGVNTSNELQQTDTVSAANSDKNLFGKLFRGFASADVLVKGENGVSLNSSNGGVVSPERVKLLMDEKVQGEEVADLKGTDKIGREKRKTLSAKKAPKPPRPPRGLSLDAADQKMIKEFAQLAMMKRARNERMKALKKMKAVKASSSSSSSSSGNLFAMLFTVIFCLVILFQGVSSRSSTKSFAGSPESARVIEDSSILNANHWNPSTSESESHSSVSPNSAEQFATLYRESKGSREAR